ncbi:fatty acid synthase subunit alpha reductase [Metarhizium album ARSEF 1941]|uniref:beta-ketoacyl-[acyl-carrier-protein] synthase I n=1 Tax=Metarhizium album (strain ARSEF 1941) TaxID=1081103 RepID=A0A0B2X6R7_METAS|nr:fatty acid synthase subunit alpha reductase [Metarhizium album ARSEF 1941]KHO00986.1 fatty acid synthase subunit alpha reductase [Metarhizium album ARSEF 1941]
MMRRTWNEQFLMSDRCHGINRQFLGPADSLDDIYYRMDASEQGKAADVSQDSLEVGTPQVTPSREAAAHAGPKPPETRYSMEPAQMLPDVCTPPSAILPVMVALKLKRGLASLQTHKSITELTEGRSALSNELVGDLQEEFGYGVPQPENIPLDQLCLRLESTHDGRLGKPATSLIFKFLSSKLPGSYGQPSLRRFLEERWGLGPMRQDAVLLTAASKQPVSRLVDARETEAFFSDVAKEYYRHQDLAVPQTRALDSRGFGDGLVDGNATRPVGEGTASLMRDIASVLNNHVGRESAQTAANNSREEDSEQAAAAESLSLWLSEHGDDYAEGIKPMFDIKKLRVYDSYWNWSAQDVERFCVLWKEGRTQHEAELAELAGTITNRACSRSLAHIRHVQHQVEKDASLENGLSLLYRSCLLSIEKDPVYRPGAPSMAPVTVMDETGNITTSEVPRGVNCKILNHEEVSPGVDFPVRRFRDGVATFSPDLSLAYAKDREGARNDGFTFSRRNVLVTGAGKDSIGVNIIRGLLRGGARVTVTTSSFSPETTRMYRDLYVKHGAKGSVLRVVPFNQGSYNDIQNLVRWIQGDEAWDLDFVVPFAAVSEHGRNLQSLDSRSELAHRAMLTNLLRMLGLIARSKQRQGTLNRPATVVLPLSPNHGLFGGDGLYGESKKALEPLLAKWYSESWAEYMSVLGVVIGWTRGTGLMEGNDAAAQFVEAMGVETFGVREMADNILTLMGGCINAECQFGPLVADLGGGFCQVKGLSEMLKSIRNRLRIESDVRKAIEAEKAQEKAVVTGPSSATATPAPLGTLGVLSNVQFTRPSLPDYDKDIAPLAASLQGMVDLSRVAVITGFSELGPHGNSRTRWDMEADGMLSVEGSVEMAWMMGLIKHRSGIGLDGTHFAGWMDAETCEAVNDVDIYARYMATMLRHTGLRKIEPSMCDNHYDPEHKETVQEIVLQHDLPPFEATPEIAEEMLRKHGDTASASKDAAGRWHVQLRAGATVMVPRSSCFNRTVAGQIPTGWSARRYGIQDDIIEQVDPVTLFSLVCTVEALLCAGIVDPYEWYRNIHVSQLAICTGSSMGGLSSLRQMHRDRFLDGPVKPDVLQETFINTTGAWINMLLMSSSGPIKTPVGACATSLESLDTGLDLIVSGKAKVVLVGGAEDFVEDLSFEFGSMNATCNTDAETAAGREPREMSRPTASTRSGFVEAQGCGVQVLTSAELALQMGLPVFGIVAYTNLSADKSGRSVPAPGIGVVGNAQESVLPGTSKPRTDAVAWPLWNLKHRRMMLLRRREQIAEYVQDGLDQLQSEVDLLRASSLHLVQQDLDQYRESRAAAIMEEGRRQEKEAAFGLGNNFWRSDASKRTSPIRGSLATWGLGVDDISVASLHGTSTVQNDTNEAFVIQEQMRHLGRRQGNLLPCVCQKWLTGHPKGAAGAWMINGCLQMMNSGRIPGNRNADNVDEDLQKHQYLWFPGETVGTSGQGHLKACSVTSFGFGQKGAQALLVHPRYLYATISRAEYEEYRHRVDVRLQRSSRSLVQGMMGEDLVSSRMKTTPPYDARDEVSALLDPNARFGLKDCVGG